MTGVLFPTLILVLFLAAIASKSHVQGCRIADAALKYDDKSYIFVGPDYITLDEEFQEKSVDNKKENWNGLTRIDAGLNWIDGSSWYHSWYPLFFEGSSYYYYSSFWGTTYGPYPVADDDSDEDKPWDHELMLEKGIDATTTVGVKSFFIKCCNFIVYNLDEREIERKGRLEEYGLPCNIHAALEMGESVMGIIKYDQLWKVDLVSGNATGPVDANEVFGLKTVRLCGEHEDADESDEDHSSHSDEDHSSHSDDEDHYGESTAEDSNDSSE